MRLPSFFAPLRRSLAWLLPTRLTKPAPQTSIKAALDYYVATSPKAAVQRAQVIGLAERRHIRAKFALRKADLCLHQASRKYGPTSPQAARASALYAKASVTLGAAAGSLYASRILLGDDLA